ncbi:MAG TPA: hypothetical protein VLA73_10915 [Burkholderiales bacterium]|nr:hypothetical protein [Burkholderiales bacterium]
MLFQLELPGFGFCEIENLVDERQQVFAAFASLSLSSVGRYLARWVHSAEAGGRAFERDPQAIARWLKEQYQAIRGPRQARRGENLLGGDERGLRSEHSAGTSYSRRGHTRWQSASLAI